MIPLKDINPSRTTPFVVYLILAVCGLTFAWQMLQGDSGMQRAIFSLGLIPGVLTGAAELSPELTLVPASFTLATSMFLHAGFLHLAGNMLYLWIFANNIEDRLGHAGFGLFYLVCGLAAAVAQIAPDPSSTVPMIGASGAVSGVLGAYLVLFPRARVVVFIPISFMLLHELRAFWLLVIWFAIQVISAVGSGGDGAGVAWWAHIGGFVAGMIIALPLRKRRAGPWG